MNKNIFKQIRINLGLSQHEYARSLGLSQTFISLMENGVYPISDNTKRKLIREFEISDDILRQLDTLQKLEGSINRETKPNKLNRIRKIFDDAVIVNLTIYEQAEGLSTDTRINNVPDNILELVEREIQSKIESTLYEVIGDVIDEYDEYINELKNTK